MKSYMSRVKISFSIRMMKSAEVLSLAVFVRCAATAAATAVMSRHILST